MSALVVAPAMLFCNAVSWACCAAQCAGSLCCSLASCFGCSDRSPVLAKLVYLVIFLSSSILAVVLRFFGKPAFQQMWMIPQINVCDSTIESCFGVQAVYRVSFALACFFAFMALLTAAAPVTHLGGWLIKLLLYTLFLGLTLLIPNADMVRYAEAARVFSVLFLLSQVIIIVDMAYRLHEYIVARFYEYEERQRQQGRHSGLLGNCWANLYAFLCLGFFIAALTGCGLMYQFFGNNCALNNFFISQTLLVGLTLSGLSFGLPGTFGKGVLPPLTIMAYNTYLTFSAITNNPDPQCNPVALSTNQNKASIIAGLVVAVVSVTYTAMSSAGNIYKAIKSAPPAEPEAEIRVNPTVGAHQGGAGAGAGAVAPQASYQGVPGNSSGGGQPKAEEVEDEEAAGRKGAANAEAAAAAAGVTAPFSRWEPFAFHLELFLAGCYVAMMASNWGDPSQQNNPDSRNSPELSEGSMWARMGSQFAIHIIFIWTLVAPAVSVCVCVTRPASFFTTPFFLTPSLFLPFSHPLPPCTPQICPKRDFVVPGASSGGGRA